MIVHGHAGHRDYCYQKLLSRTLPFASIRFDFSGCGNQLGTGTAEDALEKEIPRTVESDIRDLRTIIDYVRGQKFFVTALIGHSRGAVASIQYARTDHTIPTIVNCSGRFRGHLIHEKVRRIIPEGVDAKEVTGYWETHRAGSAGKIVDKWMLLSEIASVGAQEMAGIGQPGVLSLDLNVLIVFGSKDNVIPLADAAMYTTELRDRAELTLIDDADHNFFAPPQTKGGKKINMNQQVADTIAEYLSPETTRLRFLRRYGEIKTPRFLDVEGLSNFRDVGGYGRFPLGVVYRSADLSSLTPTGAQQLSKYVDTIFDLRSIPEIEVHGTAGPCDETIDLEKFGITRIHTPVFERIDYSPAALSKFFNSATTGSSTTTDSQPAQTDLEKAVHSNHAGMLKAYKSILHNLKPALSTLFKHLSTSRTKGILVHCAAGKDRTGVLIAILLLFSGLAPELVALEFELSTYGLQDSQTAPSGRPESKSSAELMRLCIQMLDDSFGGVETYLSGFIPDSTIQKVRNLVTGEQGQVATDLMVLGKL